MSPQAFVLWRARALFVAMILLCAAILPGCGVNVSYEAVSKGIDGSKQTDVDRAEHRFDSNGVPYLRISKIGDKRHPAWVALYALAYAGVEAYEERLAGLEDRNKFRASVHWLAANLRERSDGLWVWTYDFDSTYNDVSIRAPWSSAFAQATGIQALIASWRIDGNAEHLMLARKAAQSLFVPLDEGGFLFQRGNDIWFEEIPKPASNPSHILNGHMRVLLALRELADATQDDQYRAWYRRGLATLERRLPLYDAGYWLRYDLNPKKTELLFRLANPYGYKNHPLAVDKVALRDPRSGREIVVDVGAPGDAEGGPRIAGTDWGPAEMIDGRTARRLVPNSADNTPDQFGTPHSYFYINLPSEWTDNLRGDWYELVVEYFDDAKTSISVQQRSVAPGVVFRDMRDGDLHLTGAGHWRRWVIPVRPSDLGYWVGTSYAEKHARYLKALTADAPKLSAWAQVAQGYLRSVTLQPDQFKLALPSNSRTAQQTPMVPIYSLDREGVVRSHKGGPGSRFTKDGYFDPKSDWGVPVYSPYVVAQQLIYGPRTPGVDESVVTESRIPRTQVRREPALDWFLSPRNQVHVGDSVVFEYQFRHVYNDVVVTEPWTSAFSQAYVLKALTYAKQNMRTPPDIDKLIPAVIRSFRRDVSNGGVATFDRRNLPFFEEVPNATHILNAHLISVNQLAATGREVGNTEAAHLATWGVQSLRENLHKFDTGYWLRYDQNPKSSVLLQLDWLEGDASPLIERIQLLDPTTGSATAVDVASGQAFEGAMRISGADWLAAQKVDGRDVRAFQNGYQIRQTAVAGGGRHNVFIVAVLPPSPPRDLFDLPEYKLVLHYKDVAAGRFAIKIQAINEGSHLAFATLRNGVLTTTGDGRWKDAIVVVRPQDLGWYKGPEYQQYEVDQLRQIANLTNDWFFYQYAERQKDFFESQKRGGALEEPGAESTDQINLSVLAASPTYDGYGFENALDGNAENDYVAGMEGGGAQFVELALNHPSDPQRLCIRWESEVNYARHVRVIQLAPHSPLDRRVLADAEGLRAPESCVALSGAKGLGAFRIEFEDLAGQPRVLLRQIEIFSSSDSVLRAVAPVSHKPKMYLGPTDRDNPLVALRLGVTSRIKELSDQLADGASSDHEKILRFMEFISHFRIGVATDVTPDVTVSERVGACGSFTNTLLALAAAQGLRARAVNLHNYPRDDGHTVAEIYVEGQWRLYDPTYAAYYLLQGSGQSLPLSFVQILDAYRRGANVKILTRGYRPGLEKFTGREAFLTAQPAGPIGPDKPMVYPLVLTRDGTDSLAQEQFGPKHQGASFIGAASTNQNQRWVLRNLNPGDEYEFAVAPAWLGGDLTAGDREFLLHAEIKEGAEPRMARHRFDFSVGEPRPWFLRFTAQASDVVIELTHPYRGPGYRYMHVARYWLREIK